MTNCAELRKITKARLKSARLLIISEDWHGAAYLMGYALECALKAVICKRLNLINYPDNTSQKHIQGFFLTHEFNSLLIVSGLENIFSLRGPEELFQSWSKFTKEYPGAKWTEMRYDSVNWDEKKIKVLYEALVDPNKGLISYIIKKKKW